MNGADDLDRDPDHGSAGATPPKHGEMTNEQFAAAAAAHDARAMAAAMPGVVVVHTNLENFVRELQARQLEMARREADLRTADQMRAEVGELLQRLYDARWYGSPDDVQRTAEELGHALRETQHRISVPAMFIARGAYVRAVGEDPTGRWTAVSGIVDEATYTARREPGRVPKEEPGVHFVVTPPQRDGDRTASYDVFVDETLPLIQLPAPVDRGRPAWIEHPSTNTANVPQVDAVANPSPAPATSASEPAAAHLPSIGSARPFPPPDRIDPTTPAPVPAPESPTAPVRDRHR